MEITRVYTDSNGNSHFEQVPLNMEDSNNFGYISNDLGRVVKTYVQNTLPHHNFDLHRAPAKMYITILEGELHVEVSSGEKRVFGKGEMLCLEDVSGKGHKSKTTEKGSQVSLIMEVE